MKFFYKEKVRSVLKLILIILVMTPITSYAKQDNKETETIISSVSFSELDDSTALVKPVLDLNNEGCALIIVNCTNLENLNINGNVIKEELKDNLIWLWILNGSKNLTVSAKNMHPQTITFADYGYPSLHEFTTYRLDIDINKESGDLRYRDQEIVKEKTHKVNVYHFYETEIKTKFFVSYQFQYAFPLGINLGVCKKFGAYLFLNYLGTDSDWYRTEDRNNNWDVEFWSIGGGLMARLRNKWFIQLGGGVTMENWDNKKYFNAGASLIYKSKITLGIGYYYTGASAHYNRNILLDGLTFQIGF